jgi:DHA1 family tetracycline resistance protein-like MFS transporter
MNVESEPFAGPPAPVATPTGPRRAAVAFVFVTVMLDMLAIGIIIPVLPRLILSFLADDTADAAEMVGVFGTAWALMQFLFSPALGALSDRFGRRPIILLSNFGLGIDYVVMALAPSLGWLFVGRIVSGITAASVSTSFAYIADVTPPEKRAKAFGLMGAAFGVGFVLGPAVGGLLGSADPRLPFWVAAGLSLVNGLYGLLVLPESLAREHRAALQWKRANPLGAVGMLREHRGLLGLALVNFLGQFAHVVLNSTFVLYVGYRYGWGTRDVGLTLAAVGVCSMIVQGGLVGIVNKWLGERRTLLAGTAFGMIGFAIMGLAPTGGLIFVGLPALALWGLAGPATQSLMTRKVGRGEQGRLQGANSSLVGMANIVGPGIFTGLFAAVIGTGRFADWHLPGAPFLLAALAMVTATILAFVTTRLRAGETPPAATP